MCLLQQSPNVHDDWERLELKGGRGSATGPTRQPDESPGRDWWECESCGEGDYERVSASPTIYKMLLAGALVTSCEQVLRGASTY